MENTGLMKRGLYEEMFRQEATLWWHVGKRELVKSFIVSGGERYLDAGCGTGAMLSGMKKYYREVYGLDGSTDALEFCKKRGLGNVKLANFEKKLPFKKGMFDAVTALDVVEHVDRDADFLKELNRILAPRGKLIITVPAYRWLWTYWDNVLGHKRRYLAGEVRRLLVKSGFRLIRVSYFNSFLLSAVPIRLVKNYLGGEKSDFIDVPGPINAFILFAARIEHFLIKFIDIPFGTSIIAVGEKS